MNITEEISKLKKEAGFTENVGMVLVHNGIVRGTSKNGQKITKIKVEADFEKLDEIRGKYSKKEGIYKIVIEAKTGELNIGDDLLFIIVAGTYREIVKEVLSDVLEDIKTLAIKKEETF